MDYRILGWACRPARQRRLIEDLFVSNRFIHLDDLLGIGDKPIAAPPENPDPALEPWLKSLSTPDGTTCCSMADCRQTTARLTADGYGSKNWRSLGYGAVGPSSVETRQPDRQGRHFFGATHDNRVVLRAAP